MYFEVRVVNVLKAYPFGSVCQIPYLHSDLIILIDFDVLKDDLGWDDLEW